MTRTTSAARRNGLLVLPPVLLLALAACSTADPDAAATSAPTVTVTAPATVDDRTTPSPTPTPSASASTTGVPIEAAAAAALAAAGSGTVIAIDEDDDASWEVTIAADDGSEREVRIGADGTVVAGPTDEQTDADDRRDNRRLLAEAVTPIEDVATAALEAAGGGRLVGLALDEHDDASIVWDADVEGAPDGTDDIVLAARGGEVLTTNFDE